MPPRIPVPPGPAPAPPGEQDRYEGARRKLSRCSGWSSSLVLPPTRRCRATAGWVSLPSPGGQRRCVPRRSPIFAARERRGQPGIAGPRRPKPLVATRLAGYSPGDVVTALRGDPARRGTLALDQVIGDGLLDPGRLGGQAQMLAEHRRRQDRRGRIRLLLARDVRRAALHRLAPAG